MEISDSIPLFGYTPGHGPARQVLRYLSFWFARVAEGDTNAGAYAHGGIVDARPRLSALCWVCRRSIDGVDYRPGEIWIHRGECSRRVGLGEADEPADPVA